MIIVQFVILMKDLPQSNAFRTLEETFSTTNVYYKIHSWNRQNGREL